MKNVKEDRLMSTYLLLEQRFYAWPKNRDTGISYCRILLNDTMLNRDRHRIGISDTPMYDCAADKETVVHL